MSKSVYSIVLSDDVVAAIDMMALRMGTNRSNLINQILAEQVSVVTPERRMRDIFDNIFRLMDERFIQDTPNISNALALRSSIAYKYKPTVRYSVELLKNPEGERIGSLKISFRTRSRAFMEMLGGFFGLWINTERAYNKRIAQYKAENDKLIRGIYFPEGETAATEEQLGGLIGEYIKAFDTALKSYFAYADNEELAKKAVEAAYTNSLDKGIDRI